jgi:glyoxylase-like metal-dependent hydrolase (beta-lactamase superfamily II)
MSAHLHTASCGCSRRDVLKTGLFGCGAYVGAVLGGIGLTARRAYAAQPAGEPVMENAFARIEKIADGVWAVISTPQGGRQTFSNGGIIAGDDAVVVVEGFMMPEGARFVADAAKKLTGRAPDHVIMTHFHADHTAGMGGYLGGPDAPKLITTEKTRELLLDGYSLDDVQAEASGLKAVKGRHVLPNTVVAAGEKRARLDLGGKILHLVQRDGHTPSDLTIELEDPRVIWCGDLFFNRMFPYYGDATPTKLRPTCHTLLGKKDITYVPGHGPIATMEDQTHYLALLDHVEEAARDFHQRGVKPEEAWKEFEIPARLGEWTLLMPQITQFAFQAWEKELGA